MLQPITIRHRIASIRRSLAAQQVRDLFGLAEDDSEQTIAQDLELQIEPRDLVLFIGPSGSGKSSLLRAAGDQVHAQDAHQLELPEVPLIEALPGSIDERLNLLTTSGLGEARILLRTPRELSEGQRYRFRIAYALTQPGSAPLLLDEFTAALDRTLAKVVAYNLRKLATRQSRAVWCATTHEDILADLQPDLVVRCLGDGVIEQERPAVKKKWSASPMNSGSATVPVPTGRTSLGGIIAVITSPSREKSSSSGMVNSRSASASSPRQPLPSPADPATFN